MLQTYRATLKGDKLEWMGAVPGDTANGVEVYVTIIQEDSIGAKTSNGREMAEALRQLAASVSEISDPLAWQHDQRKDRPLPGRHG